MDYMFRDAKTLTSFAIYSETGDQIFLMISTFENDGNLEHFSISGFNIENVKSMKKLFYKTYLLGVTLNDFNTKNLEDISYMFADTGIKEFNIEGFNTDEVTTIYHLLDESTSLKEVDILTIDASICKDLSYMFHSCGTIKKDFSKSDTSKATNIAHMFQDCLSLTELKINNIDTSKVEDMSYMFDGCLVLESLDFSNWNSDY